MTLVLLERSALQQRQDLREQSLRTKLARFLGKLAQRLLAHRRRACASERVDST
jgi:hypothetical protein